jgi:hypothetical protein
MNIKLNLLAFLFIAGNAFTGFAQLADCTDPQATNYNPAATVNNGSCVYPVTNYSPVLIGNLGSALNESSGLAIINGELWSHNDSGNPNEIHRINTADATITRTVVIENATNVDWESVTQNNEYLFVGDFGNNNGNRTNLNILKIAITDILNTVNDTVQAEVIQFSYSDQSTFVSAPNNNNYDCEAFFYANDSLHLFSKNWANLKTKHYVLSAEAGTHQAALTDSLNADGLITDAATNADGTVTLLGYKNNGNNLYTCFIWLVYDYPSLYHCFGGNKRRIEIGSALTIGQTEGITLMNDNTGYISSELITAGIFTFPPKLHSFTIDSYVSDIVTTVKPQTIQAKINIYPNNFTDNFIVTYTAQSQTDYRLTDASGKVVLQGTIAPGTTVVDTRQLSAGIYFFTANSISIKLLK